MTSLLASLSQANKHDDVSSPVPSQQRTSVRTLPKLSAEVCELTVMVVDDNGTNRRLAEMMLTKLGAWVRWVFVCCVGMPRGRCASRAALRIGDQRAGPAAGRRAR